MKCTRLFLIMSVLALHFFLSHRTQESCKYFEKKKHFWSYYGLDSYYIAYRYRAIVSVLLSYLICKAQIIFFKTTVGPEMKCAKFGLNSIRCGIDVNLSLWILYYCNALSAESWTQDDNYNNCPLRAMITDEFLGINSWGKTNGVARPTLGQNRIKVCQN